MKKRIIAVVLTLALIASFAAIVSIPTTAAVMGKTNAKLVGELNEFIKTAKSQVLRDDMTPILQVTKDLQAKIDAAQVIKDSYDKKSTAWNDEADAFLVDLYGGWGIKTDEDGKPTSDKDDYLDANKPYTVFQDTLNVRWAGTNFANGNFTGVAYSLYFINEPGKTGFSYLNRNEYTTDSWAKVRDAVDYIEAYVEVNEQYPLSHMAIVTRSEMAQNLQNYYDAVNNLVKINNSTDPAALELNEYRGYLYDILFYHYRKADWKFEDLYSVMDVTTAENNPDGYNAYTEYKSFVEMCRSVYAASENSSDPAVLQQIKDCLDITPLYSVMNIDEKTGKQTSFSYTISKDEAETKLASGELKAEQLKPATDKDGNEIGGYAISYVYEAKMDEKIKNFRDNLYLNAKYSKEKNSIYNEAVSEVQMGLYASINSNPDEVFNSKQWKDFLTSFEDGDAIKNNYLTKESQMYAAKDTYMAAYKIFRQDRTSDPVYLTTYKTVKAWMTDEHIAQYTAASVAVLTAAMTSFEDEFKPYENYHTETEFNSIPREISEKLYTMAIAILTAKDNLVIAKQDGGEAQDGDIETILNQMLNLLNDAQSVRDDIADLFSDTEMTEFQQEAFDAFCESIDAFEELINTGFDEVDKKKADDTFQMTVTTKALFEAWIILYEDQNTLTLQIAAPSTSND